MSTKACLSLTVAESKRLIAKGVVALPQVKHAIANGTVAIGRGSTNAYVVEELIGRRIDRTAYVAGITLPSKPATPPKLAAEKMPDVVLRRGEQMQGITVPQAVADMQRGDVLIKGANALNYKEGVAGVLMGHPTGGTVGATLGTAVTRGVVIVIPVGLEKCIPESIFEMSRRLGQGGELLGDGYLGLMPITGLIVTEIEAIQLLAPGVTASAIGCGGICGAEGAVWLMLEGERPSVEGALAVLDGVRGEPPFGG